MPTFTTYDGTELTCRVVGNGNPLVVVPGGPLRATRYLGDLGGFGPDQELVMLELPPRRVDVSVDVFRAALQRRSAEPWFDEAHAAILAWDAGDASRANRAAAMPFFYGRWDEVAQAHDAEAFVSTVSRFLAAA